MATPVTPGPIWRPTRVRFVRIVLGTILRVLFRVRIEGADRFETGPAIYCFNHLNWSDPLFLLAFLPDRPKYALFGPKEEDMTSGGRNRVMHWTGTTIPYKPGKNDLLDATRRVDAALKALRPTLLQFHGSENETFCRSFGLPFVKTVPMGQGADDAALARKRYPSASAFLLDGHGPGQPGGRGERFDWTTIPPLGRPVFLAGGLTPANVGQAIRAARPYAVDVSSGIESAPGLKDGERMQQFVDEVRRADRNIAE